MTDGFTAWRPRVTVAAVICRDGRFLMVEERTPDGLRLNQPAGHWDPGETLLDAAVRETLEETGYGFEPIALVAVHHWSTSGDAETYLRFAFTGSAVDPIGEPELDHEIVRTHWLTSEELTRSRSRHRGPQVLACVEDYLDGQRLPLEILRSLDANTS